MPPHQPRARVVQGTKRPPATPQRSTRTAKRAHTERTTRRSNETATRKDQRARAAKHAARAERR
eukprot:14926611-Alexandrium_andersonii.AAC.1